MEKFIIAKGDKIVSQGLCISRLENNKVLFIRGALPNETVKCRVLKETKSYVLSEVEEIIEPSILRRTPICSYANNCGGCGLAHSVYEYQLELKKEIVKDNLKRIAGIKLSDIKIIPSDKSIGYRNRIRLQFKSKLGIGYFSQGTNYLIPIKKCFLARAPIRKLMPYIFSFFKEYKVDIKGQIELISPPKDTNVFCTISTNESKKAFKILEALIQNGFIKGGALLSKKQIFIGEYTLKWPYNINLRDLKKEFFIETKPGSFSQVNWQQNLKVINKIIHEAENIVCNKVVDLYSGFGNISIPISLLGKEVISVEQNPLAIEALKENIKKLGIKNIKIKCDKAENYVKELIKNKKNIDLLILDPPRKGAKEVIKAIKNKRISHIFYLSCSPATFSRDIKTLLDYNYKIKEIIAYDFFPQTYHVETLIHLTNRL